MDLASANIVKTGQNSYHVEHGNDRNLYVEFEIRAVQNNVKSAESGRPIFDEVEFVIIQFAGDRTKKVERKVTAEDRIRFKRQYESFKETGKTVQSGTPIEQWTMLTKSEAAEMKAIGIHTVESLAELPDVSLTWMGGRVLREKAKNWLKSAADSAFVSKLTSENETLRADIEALKRQITEIASMKTKKDKGE